MFRTNCLALFPLFFCLLATEASAQQNVVIVLDDSGSMESTIRSSPSLRKMAAAKSAIGTVLQQLPDDANVGLVVLNRPQNPWVIPFGPLDKSQVVEQVNDVRASGSTPLGQHMKVAADALLEARLEQFYGTYKLLIITDGEAGDAYLVEQYLPEIQARGIVVDVIGVDMPGEHSLATRANSYRKADDPDSLQQAISSVLAETTSDDGDAAESDFELLEGFPTELASAAINALATPSNLPIGGAPAAASNPGIANPPMASGSRPMNTGGGAKQGNGPSLIVILAFLLIPVIIAGRAISKVSSR